MGLPGSKGAPFEIVPILQKLQQNAAKGETTPKIVQSSATGNSLGVSYTELLNEVKAVSQALLKILGNKESPHIAYLINPSICYVVCELSVWGAGGVAVPLSVHSPAPELEYFCKDAEVSLIIGESSTIQKLKPVAETVGKPLACLTQTAPDVAKFSLVNEGGFEGGGNGAPEIALESRALILYTSGTTGQPKGAVHTFGSISSQQVSLTEAWEWSSEDATVHVLPLHHIHGVQNILNTAIFNGAKVEFTPFDAKYCLQRLCSGDMTCFHAVPTVYVKFTQYIEKCTEEEAAQIKEGLSRLRLMVCGSAALPVPQMQSWAEISGHVLLERYGMTETGMNLSNSYRKRRYPGCVGQPLPAVECKQDSEGQILVKGKNLFKEYYNRPEATAKEFTWDGWFKTGDTGQLGGSADELAATVSGADAVEKSAGRPKAEDVNLEQVYRIMGRSSVDIIKSGGYKLSALEIEAVLLSHEAIKECAVIGVPDETWGEKTTAVVVLKDGKSLTIEELRKWGKERMASYKVPMALNCWTELPRNQLGKLEKKKIMEKFK